MRDATTRSRRRRCDDSTARAITNSRSERRLTYRTSTPVRTAGSSATMRRSARRHTARARCSAAPVGAAAGQDEDRRRGGSSASVPVDELLPAASTSSSSERRLGDYAPRFISPGVGQPRAEAREQEYPAGGGRGLGVDVVCRDARRAGQTPGRHSPRRGLRRSASTPRLPLFLTRAATRKTTSRRRRLCACRSSRGPRTQIIRVDKSPRPNKTHALRGCARREAGPKQPPLPAPADPPAGSEQRPAHDGTGRHGRDLPWRRAAGTRTHILVSEIMLQIPWKSLVFFIESELRPDEGN